ncbi:MAG: nitroreductase family protein [Candidatus Symbiothrix sp.]|jgi:nitroreductase|nr:nitroreductase family protein [Candidatus Symbiothrix sp.]
MNNFAELIIHRRSVRQYTDEPLLPSEVEQILKTALMSPSSKNSRSWQFVLVENKETLQKLSVCKSTGAKFIENCALAVVVLTDPLQSEAHLEDAAIAATYLQLQAEDLGLGSCWVQIRGRETEAGYDSEQYVRDLLEIPLQLSVGCIVTIGHKERVGKPHSEEKLQWEKLHLGKY